MSRVVALLSLTALICLAAPTSARAETGTFDAAMRKLLPPYLLIHKALADDSIKGVAAQAARLVKLAAALDASSVKGKQGKHYRSIPSKLKQTAAALRKAKGLEPIRDAFKKLSRSMVLWATLSKPKGVVVIYCSMTKGSWLQLTKGVRNPYHGSKMLYCGQIIQK